MTPETFAAIQRAGQAVHDARVALDHETNGYSARAAQAMACDAFSLDHDARFEQWKSVARMAQMLQTINDQLKQIYFAAGDLAMHGGARKPSVTKVLTLTAAVPSVAVDVMSRSVEEVLQPPVHQQRRTNKQAKKTGTSQSVVSATGLKGNAGRVLDFLLTKLSTVEFSRLTHHEIAQASPIPLGSVGAAIVSLKDKGRIEEGDRGSYRLR